MALYHFFCLFTDTWIITNDYLIILLAPKSLLKDTDIHIESNSKKTIFFFYLIIKSILSVCKLFGLEL